MSRGSPAIASILALFACAFLAGHRADAAVSVSARLERNVMRVGEQNRLTIEVVSDKGSAPQPQVPNIPGLTFYSGSTRSETNVTMSGTQMIAQYKQIVTMIVVPQKEGNYQIKGIRAEQNGQTATADPIAMSVLKASAPMPTQPPGQQPRAPQQPAQSGPVRLIAEPSKLRAYVGEEIAVRYILVGRPNFIHGVSSFGNLGTGLFQRCVVEDVDLGRISLTPQTMNGQTVVTAVLKHFVLFPLSAGTIHVDPVTISIEARRSFFELPSQIAVNSQALQIEVLPLPTENQPPDFEGAVGEYRLNAKVDKTRLEEGDAFGLQVTLSGSGNIKNAPPPIPPDLSGFDQYESTKKEDVSVTTDGVSGRITYEYVLVPKDASKNKIGSFRFSYFDPQSEQYRTVETSPIQLEIVPRSEGPGDRVLLGAGAGTKREIVLTGEDFRHIAVGVAGTEQERLDLYRKPGYLAVVFAPLILLGASGLYTWRRRRLESDPNAVRLRRAPKVARRLLSEARSAVSAGDRDRAYAALSKTLVDYVGNRWNLPSSGMTSREIGRSLEDRGVPTDCAGELVSTLEELEASRFGGDMSTNSNLESGLKRTQEVLARLMEVSTDNTAKAGRGATIGMMCAWIVVSVFALGAEEAPSLSDAYSQSIGSPAAIFRRANELYEKGQLAVAANGYKYLIDQGIQNGHLHYNLGNTHFRLGELGKSIVEYERALQYMPRSQDIQHNLEFVRDLMVDEELKPKEYGGTVGFLLNLQRSLNLRESLILFAVVLWLTCIAYSIRILFPASHLVRRTGWLRVTMLIVLLFCSFSVGAKVYRAEMMDRGVVLASETEARIGPGKDYSGAFTLHEGTMVELELFRPSWVRVRLPNGLTGWLQRKDLEVI